MIIRKGSERRISPRPAFQGLKTKAGINAVPIDRLNRLAVLGGTEKCAIYNQIFGIIQYDL
jgi:hypothetical protein